MRTLTSTLKAAQQSRSMKPTIKLALTFTGKPTYTFYASDRILSISTEEQPWSDNATITLDNSDGFLTNVNLRGYKATIDWGLVTSKGNEYSTRAPLNVISQIYSSSPGGLICELQCIGLIEAMAEDRANTTFIPTTETVKELISAIMGSTLAPYNDLPSYTVVYDSEDSLIGTFVPKHSFRIFVNTTRLSAIKRLLAFTKCVGRFEGDGKFHIFVPKTTGTNYDYEYSLDGEHTFFTKTRRNRIVIPNWITVTDYNTPPTYSGFAKDQASIDSYRPVKQHEKFYNIASNAQATALAEAILSQYQIHAEMASAQVPMNVGAEVYDYVKITDKREGTTFVGNVGVIRRTYRQGVYQMSFIHGGWLSLRKIIGDIDADGSPSDRNIVAKYIIAKQIDFTDITQDEIHDGITYKRVKSASVNAEGLIFLDGVTDVGNTYKRVLGTQLSAGKILLSDQCEYAPGYNPITKEREIKKQPTAPPSPATGDLWLDTSVTPNLLKRWTGTAWVKADPANQDDLPDGITYHRIRGTELSAGRIVLSAANYWAGKFSGEWYNESGVEIDSTHGINIYGTDMALTTRATKTGTVRCYVGSDGKLVIRDGFLHFRDSSDESEWGAWYFNIAKGGLIYASSRGLIDLGRDGVVGLGLAGGAGFGITPSATTQQRLFFRASYDHMYSPSIANFGYLGDPTFYWYRVYCGKYYAKDTTIGTWQEHDDIALIKSIKSKKVTDKHGQTLEVIDASALPKEIFVREKTDSGGEETFIDLGNFTSLAIGAIRQLAERVEKLEAKVKI